MTFLRKAHGTLASLLLATAASTLGLAGCSSLTPIDTVRTITRTHGNALDGLARRAQQNDVEHGAWIVGDPNGETIYVEIRNKIADDRQTFERFLDGDQAAYQTLTDHIQTAVTTRSDCNPELGFAYAALALDITGKLYAIRYANAKAALGDATWRMYDSLVMHNIFCAREDDCARARTLGERILSVHTHEGDMIAEPSLRDLHKSTECDEAVIAIDRDGNITYFLAREGKTTVLYRQSASTSLARAD